MQRVTRSSSDPSRVRWNGCQALKKSTCMVEYAPEESVGLPFVVGMRNRKFVWSRGTGYGWVLGHLANPPVLGVTASTMCERWGMALGSLGSVSSNGCGGTLSSTARQSGKKMRTTNVPLSHRVGGVSDHVPF